MATEEHFNVMNFPPSPPLSSNSIVVYLPPRSPSSSNSMVVYQASGQSSMDNPLQNRQQRPANSGDQSDMATEEHFDVMSLLNLPQLWPPPSPCSSANSMLVYQQEYGQSYMDFVDRPLYITRDIALFRQELLKFWTAGSYDWMPKPRGGIMSMNKENLPQSLECLGISLLHLYVEDEFDTLLYWQGESSWAQLRVYLQYSLTKLLQVGKFVWVYECDDLERKDYGQCMFATERVTMGVWQIGPREWVAKIRYQRRSLQWPFYVDERGQNCYSQEVHHRTTQVVLEDARLNFPDLIQDFLHAVAVAAAHRKDPAEDDIDYFWKTPPFIDGCRLSHYFVNGRIRGERTEEAEITESELNPGPSRKRQRKEKTATGEKGNKKTTPVKNVITLDKILQVKELRAAELLKVSQSALKRACREHGINRWPPCDKHEGITQSLPDKTPTVVDQEGIPQLTSDTLPSDQALTATVDTNSVAEETASQQFLLIVREGNPDENSGNAEVELVGMGGVGTRESEMRRNGNAPGREREVNTKLLELELNLLWRRSYGIRKSLLKMLQGNSKL